MGYEIFKRMQRLQGGSEAVAEELPSPPYEGENYAGKGLKWLANEVRQGVLPDEALAEMKRDPTSLRSILGYGEAALAAGTLLSGGGGGKLPKGEGPISTVAYHGSRTESPKFEIRSIGNDIGVHFGTAEQADWRVGDEGTVTPHQIEIKNPLRLDDLGGWYGEAAVKHINDTIGSKLSPSASVGTIRRAIQDAGYDGVVYKNKFEHDLESPDEDSYIVFHPDQIKSSQGYVRGTTTVKGYGPTHGFNQNR